MRFIVWCFGLALMASACGPDRPSHSWRSLDLFHDGAGVRLDRDATYDTVWAYGKSDSILANAHAIEALGDGDVVVLDVLAQRIHRIGPHGVLWSWGRRGQGPREFRNVRSFTINDNDEIVLADSGNRRIVWVSSRGQWLRETALPNSSPGLFSGAVTGLVALPDGGYVLSRLDQVPWIEIPDSGGIGKQIPVPWDGFGMMHPLQTLGHVATGAGSTWVFGFALGNGFFVFDNLETVGSYRYLSHAPFPEIVIAQEDGRGVSVGYLERPRYVARDMHIRGDTLWVLASYGRLDSYDLASGHYIESITLPGLVKGFTWSGDLLVVIHATGLYPAISALQLN